MQPKTAANTFLFATDARRDFLGRLAGVAISSLAAGCPSRKPTVTSSTGAVEKSVLRIHAPTELARELALRYGSDWASQSGYRLEAAGGSREKAAVWLIRPYELGELAKNGQLREVPSAIQGADHPFAWANVLPLYRFKLLNWNGVTFALPVQGEGYLCYYRSDLLQNAEQQRDFEKKVGARLAPPTTWEDYLRIAAFFHGRSAPGTIAPLAGSAPLPSSADDLDREFFWLASSLVRQARNEEEHDPAGDGDLYSFQYDVATGQPWLAHNGFKRALQLLCELQKLRGSSSNQEPATAFAEGQCVLCLAGPEWILRFQESAATKGRFGFCRVPGASVASDGSGKPAGAGGKVNWVPYVGSGGWLGVVPKSCDQPDAAFGLLAALGSPAVSTAIAIEPRFGGGVFRRDHVTTRGWQAFGLAPADTDRLVDYLRQMAYSASAMNPALRLRIPNESEHQRVLLEEVVAAVQGRKNPETALKDAAKRWTEMDQGKNVLADYRISLGLNP